MSDIAGSWRIGSNSEPAFGMGDHAYYFSAHGELILSTSTPEGIQRAMLTWKYRGDLLVVDQPSAPREEAVRWVRASEHTMQLDDSWYLREENGRELDSEAPWFALVAGGVWYGIENASPEPFIPFLMLETGAGRRLQRVVASDSDGAEQMAAALLARESYDRAVWVRDGRVRYDGEKLDAIIATRFEPGARRGVSHALPYRLDGARARIAGGMETFA